MNTLDRFSKFRQRKGIGYLPRHRVHQELLILIQHMSDRGPYDLFRNPMDHGVHRVKSQKIFFSFGIRQTNVRVNHLGFTPILTDASIGHKHFTLPCKYAQIGLFIMKPQKVKAAGFILYTYPEQPFATAEKPLLPAGYDLSSDPYTHTVRRSVDGQDPSPVLISNGTEPQEINKRMKTPLGQKFSSFRSNSFQRNEGAVQFRNMFKITGRWHTHQIN